MYYNHPLTGNKMLAHTLDSIANGVEFSESALIMAKRHPVATHNDRQMLTRWLYGMQTATDSHALQQLAIYIREYSAT